MKSYFQKILFAVLFSLSALVIADPVDINTADAKTLAANINGIGEKKAEAIVEYREKHGPFKSANDLTKIKGIGPKLVEKNRSVILVKNTK